MSSFNDLIQRDRGERKKINFEGTFLDYLDIVKEDPSIAMLVHERMFKTISSKGEEVIDTTENPRLKRIHGNDVVKRYNFFKNDFFGIDKVLMKIVSYLSAAAMKENTQNHLHSQTAD